MAFKVAVIIASAVGATPERQLRNLTRTSEPKAEHVVHKQANRSKLAAVHASTSVVKNAFHEASYDKVLSEYGEFSAFRNKVEATYEKEVHHQNKTVTAHVLNITKDSARETTNASKPSWGARKLAEDTAFRAKTPMATARISKPDPMNSAGVHAYPMVHSKTKRKVAYTVERRNSPHVVAHAQQAQCECTFEGICEPQPAMTFMSCLQKACSNGNDCQCEEQQYVNACHQLGDACKGTALQLTCFADRTDAVMLKAATETDAVLKHNAAEEEKAAEKAEAAEKEAEEEEKEAEEKAAKTEKAAEKAEADEKKADAEEEAARRKVRRARRSRFREAEKEATKTQMKTVSWTSSPKPEPAHTKATTATTTQDPVVALYADLEKQKEELCGLTLSHEAGFLNAAAHKQMLSEQIDKNLQELEERCKELPEMHCEKDFHEYSAPREECGVEVDNEFTRNAFGHGGGASHGAAQEKSGCVAAVPALSVAAILATLQ